MVQAFLILLLAQTVGDWLAGALRLPAPGMVVGLALLLAAIAARGRLLGPDKAVPSSLPPVAQGLHAHLGLLFVPAGADIVAHLDVLAREGAAILVAVLGSTLIGIALTARIAAAAPLRQVAR
jgi:putative effector of murein hydrolase LrgA (UPF0299 family)